MQSKSTLAYYIWEGLLTGIANGIGVTILAGSGGGAGSTKHPATSSANNPYMEGLKTRSMSETKGHVHGGPIPPGKYAIKKPRIHNHLGFSAELVHPRWKPMGRDGFYIHGRGPHGSDGCIVPLDPRQFQNLMSALTASDGGTLYVEESMEGGFA